MLGAHHCRCPHKTPRHDPQKQASVFQEGLRIRFERPAVALPPLRVFPSQPVHPLDANSLPDRHLKLPRLAASLRPRHYRIADKSLTSARELSRSRVNTRSLFDTTRQRGSIVPPAQAHPTERPAESKPRLPQTARRRCIPSAPGRKFDQPHRNYPDPRAKNLVAPSPPNVRTRLPFVAELRELIAIWFRTLDQCSS